MKSLLPLAAVACMNANEPTYFPPPAGPLEAGGTGQPGNVSAEIVLPFRPPDAANQAEIDATTNHLGFGAPWLSRGDVAISLQYTITNLSDQAGRAQLFIDGASEFASYDAAALRAAQAMAGVNQEDIIVMSLITGIPVNIQAGKHLSGIVREDEFAEAALDLDAIGRWTATPAAVLINASEANPIGLDGVPPNVVVPSLFRVNLTFTASTHMRLDFLVRVRDDKDRLATSDEAHFQPTPTAYTYMP